MEAMNNLVDINALVERCCWKDSRGEMEGESFLEECIALKESMAKMKERYMNLLSERYNILHQVPLLQWLTYMLKFLMA